MKRVALITMLSCSLCGCDTGVYGAVATGLLGLLGMGGQSEAPQTGTPLTPASSPNLLWLLVVPLAIIIVLSVPKEDRK